MTKVDSVNCNVITVNSQVEHVISHVLLSEADPQNSVSADDYILKVYGLEEYLDK